MSLAVANEYAKALLEVVDKPGSNLAPESVLEQLEVFEALVAESHEFRVALLSPAISPAQKSKVIARLGGMIGLFPVVRNFLNIVVGHRRVALLPLIRLGFRAHLDDQLGIVRASIAAARDLSPAQKTALEAGLAGSVKGSLRYKYTVDGALLGGLTVQIGSKVLDGSVRGKLDSLRRRLVAEA
jgi:F-type H+-transporting ATPase subunit delta